MSSLPDGEYRTAAGSTVKASSSGSTAISFDWFEEEDACLECYGAGVACRDLAWECDECGGGSANLVPLNPPALALPWRRTEDSLPDDRRDVIILFDRLRTGTLWRVKEVYRDGGLWKYITIDGGNLVTRHLLHEPHYWIYASELPLPEGIGL